MGSMQVTRIHDDDEGGSHFETTSIELSPQSYAPPAPAFDVSGPIASTRAVLVSFPVGWFGDWHPSPRRQLYFALSGHLEVTVSDGERRVIGPGDIVLGEDLHGRGHTTRTIGDEPATGAHLHLAEDDLP